MKFGRNLPQNQVLEWSAYYVYYKDLKKLVSLKASDAREKSQDTADIQDFLTLFNRNLDNVSAFYDEKLSTARNRVNSLKGRFGGDRDLLQNDLRELLWALMKMQGELENLLWFGEVNRKALVRITSSSVVKIPPMEETFAKLERKVDGMAFARGTDVAGVLVEVNEWLAELKGALRVDEADKGGATAGRQGAGAAGKELKGLAAAKQAVRDDDGERLQEVLESEEMAGVGDGVLRNLLQQAVSRRSRAITIFLLEKITSLDEPDDINKRNLVHRLVIQLARTMVKADVEAKKEKSLGAKLGPGSLKRAQSSLLEEQAEDGYSFLSFLLGVMPDGQRGVLLSKDVFGRTPLHYAVRFGLETVTEKLASCMEEWGQIDISNGIDGPEWRDEEGYAPIHLAVNSNYPKIALALINGGNPSAEVRQIPFQSGDLLILATKFESPALTEILLRAGINVNWQDKNGETALHVASRLGYTECVDVILKGAGAQKVDTEIVEQVFGRSSLHIAAVYGHLGVAESLLRAGADALKLDSVGWTAKEQAAFRGYMKIASLLEEAEERARAEGGGKAAEEEALDLLPSLAKRKKFEPLEDESLIMVSLGSMDPTKDKSVSLDLLPLTGKHIPGYATALSLRIAASEARHDETIIDLPILEDISTRPALLYASDPADVTIYFDIIPTYATGGEKIGRAVAPLSSLKKDVGPGRMNLQGDLTVPIMAANLEIIGTVSFSYLVITPYWHPKMPLSREVSFWEKHGDETMVIGHRGLGMNQPGVTRRLQIGENTVESMELAGRLGAEFVEFDVQLTSDHVPVIYHDFLLAETGTDTPIYNVSHQQFTDVNPGEKAYETKLPGKSASRPRSRSVGYSDGRASHLAQRIQHTRDFASKGFKPNTRGDSFIQCPFTTLATVLETLPTSVGLNIEMKYPSLFETQHMDIATYAVEVNTFCDTVLDVVFSLARGRRVVFSSFHPDVCLCLRFKQRAVPVLFLTDAGVCPAGDVRSSSLQEGISFAKRWGLMGVVCASEVLVNSPRLIRSVKETGMLCLSYGVQNSDVELVRKQVRQGIDAVIVDDVVGISKSLGKMT